MKIKSEPKEFLPAPSKVVAHPKTRRITANNVRVNDLPGFITQSIWRNKFLPTLYDKFFTSDEPFAQFYKASDTFITLLQEIVDEVFPNTSYKANTSDALHQLVSQLNHSNTQYLLGYTGIQTYQ